MTSFLDVIAHDDSMQRTASRKAIVLAKQRTDKMFSRFLAQQGPAGLPLIEEDMRGVVTAACEEVGHEDVDSVFASVLTEYTAQADTVFGLADGKAHSVTARTAATIHEARKPKMCPFHRDVVDISLADGNPRSGFDAMAQHWGGSRHCDGDGYEGGKCNFKPQMTTQSYWDEKAEKAEERRQQRQEQQDEQAQQTTEPQAEVDDDLVNEEAVGEPEAVDTTEAPQEQGAEVIDFPTNDGGSESVADEVPMSMAASTKVADGGPVPVMDKRKWTPQSVPFLTDVDDPDGPHPTKRKDIVDPIKADNNSKLDEIGEQVTERVDVTQDHEQIVGEGTKVFKGGPGSAVSSSQFHDPDKNPIVALMQGEFDGFEPHSVVQAAITKHRTTRL